MSGAGFLLAINLSLSVIFAGTFWAIALFSKTHRSARWFALAFVFGIANLVFEYLIAAGVATYWALYGAAVGFLCAALSITIGLARHYRVRFGRVQVLSVLLVSATTYLLILGLPRDTLTYQIFYQLPYAGVLTIATIIVARSERRAIIDRVLLGLLVISAIHFLLKPGIAQMSGGIGARPEDYVTTLYALISQSTSSVLTLAIAVVCLLVLSKDILAEAIRRAETDPETGIPNRRGFEVRAHEALLAHPPGAMGPSLILIEIEGLEALATSGGDAARRALTAFAELIVKHAGQGQDFGRTGTQEFAILMAEANLFAARRHAELLKSGMSALFPAAPLTASFGVAESERGDSLLDLMRRAEGALYDARRAGGGCVRLAVRSNVAMPALTTSGA